MQQETNDRRILPTMTLAEVVRAHPSTHRALHELGVHVCHFGAWTLQEACRYQLLDVESTLARLNSVAEAAEAGPAPTSAASTESASHNCGD